MFKVLALALILPLINAQVPTSASTLQLEEVDAQYINEGFAGGDPTIAFGVALHSEALLTVIYNGTQVTNGAPLTQAQVATLPTVFVTPGPGAANNFSSSDKFTLTLADASALGSPDPQENFRHYLANGLSGGSGADFQLNTTNGNVITFYSGPGPAAGQGPHRYAWLLFQQPSTFTAPANLSTSGTAPDHWSVSSYVSSSGLGQLVAATFFTVENGQATYTVGPTSSVDPKTLPAFQTSTSSGSSTSSSGSQPTETKSSSGAAKNAAGILAAMGVVAVGLLA